MWHLKPIARRAIRSRAEQAQGVNGLRHNRPDVPSRRQGSGKLLPDEERKRRSGDVKADAWTEAQPKMIVDAVLTGIHDELHAQDSRSFNR